MLLNSAVAFLLIILFGYFLYSQFNLHPALTPLISITLLVDTVILMSLVNKLYTGVVIAYSLSVVCFLFSIYKDRKDLWRSFKRFFTPGVIMFTVAGLLFMAVLFTRKPVFSQWDEFSFWGTAAKLVKTRGALYTYYKSSMIGNSTPPALAVLTYFFQCFTPQFLEHGCYFRYDILILSVICAITRGQDRKNWDTQFFLFLFGFILPYLFSVYTKLIFLDYTYVSSYSEVPLGMVFLGAFAVYFNSRENRSATVISVLPVLMFLTMTKDMGLALSCIVAFMAFFDMLCYKNDFSFLKLKRFPGKILAALTMVLTAGASYFLWVFHMSHVMQRDRFATGGNNNLSMVGILVSGVKEFLGLTAKSEKFATIQGYMTNSFFNIRVSIFGTGIVVFVIITLIFALAFLLSQKRERARCISAYITSTIGFVGYYLFHLFLYVYIFKDNGYSLVSYNRYMSIYYIGWLGFAVTVLAQNVNGKWTTIAKISVVSVVLIMFGLFTKNTDPTTTFIENDRQAFKTKESVHRRAEYMRDIISPDDVVYIYSETGERWFMYTLELSDNYLAEIIGISVEKIPEEEQKDAWQEHLKEEIDRLGVTKVIVEGDNDFLRNTYSEFFDDGLLNMDDNYIGCYKVCNGENLQFQLIKGGIVQ